jgi:hypothetical protein
MAQLIRLSYGCILAVLLFVPFGVYHSTVEPYITGFLFGYNLPVGYVSLLLGAIVIFYPKIAISKRVSLQSFMPLIGLALIVSFLLSPKDAFINLFNGANFSPSQIDVDFPIGNALVWGMSLLSISAGLAIAKNGRKEVYG